MRKYLALIFMVLLLLSAVGNGAAAEDDTEPVLMTEINNRKHIVQYVYKDQDDQIVSGPNGYAIIECQYDGNKEFPFKVRYLDVDGKRMNNPDDSGLFRQKMIQQFIELKHNSHN